jgi:hypothetical protein
VHGEAHETIGGVHDGRGYDQSFDEGNERQHGALLSITRTASPSKHITYPGGRMAVFCAPSDDGAKVPLTNFFPLSVVAMTDSLATEKSTP